jgi:predicted small metal-binding protein
VNKYIDPEIARAKERKEFRSKLMDHLEAKEGMESIDENF